MFKTFTNHLLVAFLMITFTVSYAQKEVRFQLNQFIGAKAFVIGDKGTNDLGTKFSVTRLDYYISSIQLHHDGGKTTNVDKKYIFVSKGKKVDELLGTFNINQLDSITFSIGVEATDNHADPTLWTTGHPLAPKSPEMHWGWASGFRFVAIEGKSGSNYQFNYEIHALGDENYKSTTIVTSGTELNGSLFVEIDADYEHGFKTININKNLILHGTNKEAVTLLKNYNDHIFTAVKVASSSSDIEIGELKLYPNPSTNGNVILSLTDAQIINSQVIVRDALGRNIIEINNPTTSNNISLNQAGFYLVELMQSGKITHRSSIVIQ